MEVILIIIILELELLAQMLILFILVGIEVGQMKFLMDSLMKFVSQVQHALVGEEGKQDEEVG